MDKKLLTGTVTFVHHDKKYVTIEYEQNGKKKTINGNISSKEQLKLKKEKIIQKEHKFQICDTVNFIIVPSAKGDKMVADCIQFLYNNPLDNLIKKAAIENRFVGYLKKVDAGYFVKETYSYLLFPLIVSPWEIKPIDEKLNEPIYFSLENFDNPEKVTASLYKTVFIHEYSKASRHFKTKTPVEATVYKVSPHGIFVNIFSERMQAKLSPAKSDQSSIKVGDTIQVLITYLGKSRIVIEKV